MELSNIEMWLWWLNGAGGILLNLTLLGESPWQNVRKISKQFDSLAVFKLGLVGDFLSGMTYGLEKDRYQSFGFHILGLGIWLFIDS